MGVVAKWHCRNGRMGVNGREVRKKKGDGRNEEINGNKVKHIK